MLLSVLMQNEPIESASVTSSRLSQTRLKITEIFQSIQGESTLVGLPTTFVRLTGCPLRCVYCDTAYAFQGGEWKEVDEILVETRKGPQHVCVTGGEPLAQKAVTSLLSALCDAGHTVSLETSGALSIAPVDARVIVVMDVKTPSSQESHRNLESNAAHLKPGDQVKFVIGDRADFDWSLQWLQARQLSQSVEVLWSPIWDAVQLRDLAQWVVDCGVPGRMQVQLHKFIWGQEQGR